MENQTNTIKLFRILGAMAIFISGTQFLLSGRYSLNSLQSHYIFLGINFLVSLLGVFSFKVWREFKTTRAFLGVSLALVPVHMAQLGAFFLDHFNRESSLATHLFQFELPVQASLGLVTMLTLFLSIPVTMTAFKVLSRSEWKSLSMSYLLMSLSLLIPFRVELSMFILIGGIFLFSILNLMRKNKTSTFERTLAKVIHFIPSIILIGRSCLYLETQVFILFIGLVFSILFFLFPHLINRKREWIGLTQGLFAPSLFTSLLLFAELQDLSFSIAVIGFLVLLHFMSYFVYGTGKKYRQFCCFALPMIMLTLFPSLSNIHMLVALIIPAIFAYRSFLDREKKALMVNLLTLKFFCGFYLVRVVRFPTFESWYYLALIGILFIFLAGFLEKNLGNFGKRVKIIFNEFS